MSWWLADRGQTLDRESVRVRLPSSLTRRLGTAMRASQNQSAAAALGPRVNRTACPRAIRTVCQQTRFVQVLLGGVNLRSPDMRTCSPTADASSNQFTVYCGRQSYTPGRKPYGSATASIATNTTGTLATSRQAPGSPPGAICPKRYHQEGEVSEPTATVSPAVLR